MRNRNLPRALGFLAAFVLVHLLSAQPYVAGQSYFGANNYIEYRAGNLPIILTAPHGGSLTPGGIPDRANGTYNGVTYTDVVTTNDANTVELTEAIALEIFNRTGRRPHVILNRLRRSKLDANREIGEAAQGNALAEQAWRDYTNFINAARAGTEAEFGFGYLLDIHGHAHAIQRVELGYNYSSELNLNDTALNHPGILYQGTLRTLALQRPGVPFHTLLRGAGSLGDLLNDRGIPSWPSPSFPSPGLDPFFGGGHTVEEHTCRNDNGVINGVQLEHYNTGIRDTSTNRANYATALTRALHLYLFNNYGYSLDAYSVSRLGAPTTTKLIRGGAPLTITVNRTGNLALGTTLALSFGGTAVLGADYTASTTSLNLPANQASGTFTLTPAAAPDAGGDKSILVALAPTISQTAAPTPLALTLGDGTNQTVRLTAAASSVAEGAGAAVFQIERTLNASELTVPLAWSGTALPEADYHSAPSSVTFAAGVASVEIGVPLVNDGRPEADKTLVATVESGSGYIVGLAASATVAIIDDDRPAGLAAWLRGELASNVAPDSSGNNRHATTLPATSSLSAGPTSLVLSGGVPAINFDGSNDTAALPRFTPDPNGEFTVAFFFRLTTHANTSSDQSLLSYGSRGAVGSLHVYLSSSTNLRTSIPSPAGALLIDTTLASPDWQDGVWRHYALSVSSDGSVRVYLNGVPRPTATGRIGSLAPNELFWLGWRAVGGTGSTTNSFMRGALRDFRVYQRALGQAEITALTNEVQNYAAWLAQNNLPANLLGSVDSDSDGFPALVEYGLAARPALADSPPRYTVQTINGRLQLTFLRDTAASDATWTIEASTDLGTWQPLAQRTGAAAQWTILTSGAAATEQNGYTVVTDAAPLVTGRFLRLRVSIP